MSKETFIEEFNHKLDRIEREIEDQQQEIYHKSNNLLEWEKTLITSIKKYFELTDKKDRQEYLNQNNYGSIIDCLNAYIDYAKKLDVEIQKYNDFVNRIAVFEVEDRQVKGELEHVINRIGTFTTTFSEEYVKLIRETSDFLKLPKEENLEQISKIIKNIAIEDIIYENKNILNDSSELISSIKTKASSSIENDEVKITINEENYNPTNVFYNSVEQPSNIIANPLGENRHFNINNGLRVPKVSLEELIHYSYRAHNISDGNHYSINDKKSFTDDEFVYQEFLSYITYKMRENEPRLTMKLEGLHPTKKREMLESYLNNILEEITSNIKIDNGQVTIPDYLLESSAVQYILRVNGYDIERTNNIKDFLNTSSRGTLLEVDPIDELEFTKKFSESYKPTTLDDANLKSSLNDGRGINENDFENAQKAKQRIENLKELIINFLNEEDFEKQQKMIDEIDDYRINDLIKNEYNNQSVYNRNIKFIDQLRNFQMLINNNLKIENLKTKLIKSIYQKLSVNYSEKNRNVSPEVKKELCESIIQECDAILSATEQIIDTYQKENKIIKVKENTRKNEITEQENQLNVTLENAISLETRVEHNNESALKTESSKKETQITNQNLSPKKKSTKAYKKYDNLSEEGKSIYDTMMKKSYTRLLDKLTNQELAYCRQVFKKQYDELHESFYGKEDQMTQEQIQCIVIFKKIDNRYNKIIKKDESIKNISLEGVNQDIIQNLNYANEKINSGGR